MLTIWLNQLVNMKKIKDATSEKLILNAAENIFIKKGMDGARMQEIADEAGINKALLHYYFRNKQQLFEAVFMNAFSLLAPQLNSILNDDSSIEEKIIKIYQKINFACLDVDILLCSKYQLHQIKKGEFERKSQSIFVIC